MAEEYSVDPAQLLEAATDFAYHPGICDFFLTCFSSLVNKQLVNLCILQFFQALFPMLQLKTFLIDFLFQPLSSIYYFLYSVLSALST